MLSPCQLLRSPWLRGIDSFGSSGLTEPTGENLQLRQHRVVSFVLFNVESPRVSPPHPLTVANPEEDTDGLTYEGYPGVTHEGDPGVTSIPTRGVAGNTPRLSGDYAVPPGVLTADSDDDAIAEAAAWLDTAAPLALDAKPSTAAAIALVDAVTGMVLAHEGKRRGPKLRAKLTEAVGAIVGALLKNWSRPSPRPVFRSGEHDHAV